MEIAVRTLNLDILPTRPVCTSGGLFNKFSYFDSTLVLPITPSAPPIAPAPQHIHSICTGGKASIVIYPPAVQNGVRCGVQLVASEAPRAPGY